MNATLHLIRKDLAHFRWALLVWALSLGYLFFVSGPRPPDTGNLRDYFQLTAMLLLVVATLGLIAGIVQEDHPTAPDVRWRTMPISSGRLLISKLLLLELIFVGVPLALFLTRRLIDTTVGLDHPLEYAMAALILSTITLSLMAVASCVKNVVYTLLLWLGLMFGAMALARMLNEFAPVLSREALAHLGLIKVLVILGFGCLVSLAVVMNQYLRRQLATSIGLLLFGAVGSAVIGSLWGYFYFYSSQ